MKSRILFAAALALAESGCINLTKDFPDRRFWSIHATRPAGEGAPAAGTVLKVRPLQVGARFAVTELVFRTGDNEYESDFYNAWFVPPRDNLTEETRSWVQQAGVFGEVVDVSSLAQATHVLEGRVTRLHGDERGEGARAVIEIRFFLLDDRANPPGIVMSKTYLEETPVAGSEAVVLVEGWNAGLAKILGALEADLRGAVKP
jgi:uncharacterized lipoprotein YmbA